MVADGRVVLARRRTPVRLPRAPESRRVAGADPATVALDIRHRRSRLATLAGLVVAAAGGGNTPPAHLDLARSLIERGVPVVLTTRCPSGRPMPGYGFPGGSSQWWEAGALFSGTLDALKARVLVALGRRCRRWRRRSWLQLSSRSAAEGHS